jgi:hypothetical protein
VVPPPPNGSTCAVLAAAGLGYALLSKDRIKETLHDALGAPEPDRAWSAESLAVQFLGPRGDTVLSGGG